jgi:hypothetical protein
MKFSWGRLVLAWWVVVPTTAVSTAPGGPPPTSRRARAPTASHAQAATVAARPDAAPLQAFLDTYCATCHNQRLKTAGLALDILDVTDVAAHAEVWEKVVVKLRAGLMPPSGVRRPEPAVIDGFTSSL